MSAADARAALLALDRVVADPLRFKSRLRIGEDAYALKRLTKAATGWWESASAGMTGAGVAKSAVVAGALFAPSAETGLIAWLGSGLGLAAPAVAVTPVGWVVAATVLAGGGYYGVTRWLASGSSAFVEVIPKFVNTPLDKLGTALFDLLGGLAIRVAASDGAIDPAERAHIVAHFVHDWGYDPAFAEAALALLERDVDAASVEAVAHATAEFQAANPDCNAPEMQRELMQLLREVIAADGRVDAREEQAIAAIEAVFAEARRWSLASVYAGVDQATATLGDASRDAVAKARGVVTRLRSR